jgi:hypothetical protein
MMVEGNGPGRVTGPTTGSIVMRNGILSTRKGVIGGVDKP